MGVQSVTRFLAQVTVCPTRAQERNGLPNDDMSKEIAASRGSNELLDHLHPQEADTGKDEQAQRRAGPSRE